MGSRPLLTPYAVSCLPQKHGKSKWGNWGNSFQHRNAHYGAAPAPVFTPTAEINCADICGPSQDDFRETPIMLEGKEMLEVKDGLEGNIAL